MAITGRHATNLVGALGIAGTLLGIAVGLPALDRSVPSQRPVRDDQPYPIGAGITVVPPTGATVDLTRTRPGAHDGRALFRLGSVQYAIEVRPFDGILASAAERLRTRITAVSGYQVTGPQLPVSTVDGLSGLQGGYTAPGRGGRYAVFVTDGLTIEVTITGADLDLGGALPQIEASTRTLRHVEAP